MPTIGPLELAIVVVIVMLLFGAKRLPELGRSAGKGIREFKSGLSLTENSEAGREEGGSSDRRRVT
jgi:sec-independent protein translocase protein TatA